eukprot:CAMPEP_0202961886 /NCGR_PEP_ID=MMETSP1396-20130829/5984_1 /ASSEMBLY_ACC=CAM_ASM_000872 /TAXON_ID= /ORGANISM="Pseudokeronopsis sp., Strain Brazil" /LENGTH=50 /DNA_ID=CAMNT_0049682085 /DNA_START=1426 /DNA_END=1578 /DNA_ORIENTATION=-
MRRQVKESIMQQINEESPKKHSTTKKFKLEDTGSPLKKKDISETYLQKLL